MRRLALVVALLLGAAPAPFAQEASPPTGPVRVIVPYGAGSFSDVLARKVANELATRSGIAFSVENVVGAGGVIGTQAAARANPDGNTLLLIASNHAMNAALHKDLTYDPIASFVPVAHVTYNPFAIVVNEGVEAETLQDYLDGARAEPGTYTYGSAGIGSSPHFAIEKLAYMGDVELKHIPYRETGQMLNDLLGGRFGMAAYSISPLQPHLESGKLRALAVTGKSRSDLLPEVPTVAEAGVPGYDMVSWNGFMLPAGTPPETAAFYATEIEAIVTDPAFTSDIQDLGAVVEYLGPEDFSARLASETAYWKKLVDDVQIELD